MTHYAGLDVSLKEVSICIIDDDGEVVAQGIAPTDPEGVAGWLKNRLLTPKRIVHESGQLSIWLQRGMVQLGLPATCIDARKAHKSLSARLNKSDSAPSRQHTACAPAGQWTRQVSRSSHERTGSLRFTSAAKSPIGCVPWSEDESVCSGCARTWKATSVVC